MKIKFVSWIILFQNTLEFKHIIALCYGRQQSLTFQGHVPSPQVWVKSTSPNSCEFFGSHGATMCVEQKIELIDYFPIPLLHQFHLYVKCGWIAWYLIPLRPMTLMLSFKSYDNACKKSCTSFEALPFIYAFFFHPEKLTIYW